MLSLHSVIVAYYCNTISMSYTAHPCWHTCKLTSYLLLKVGVPRFDVSFKFGCLASHNSIKKPTYFCIYHHFDSPFRLSNFVALMALYTVHMTLCTTISRFVPQCSNIHLVICSFHSLPVRLLMRVIQICTSNDYVCMVITLNINDIHC